MGFRGLFQSKPKAVSKTPKRTSGKKVTESNDHEYKQVIGFQDASNDGSRPSEMGRELFSFPKPEHKETMADYINNHKEGDIFPYVTVTGQEDETKDSRLARLRSFVSPYGKSVKPEMRINGVILDLLDGSLCIDELKQHVDNSILSKAKIKENKRFNDINEHVFTKPYVQLRRITGEFVPLLSGTADYTDLVFSLQDGRLLDHQIVVQSNKIPTNSAGVFEMSCDYCIPTRDIRQLSIKYELARPIMREGYQWGTVSMCISICEADTPYITPKVEAIGIVRMPYTAMEDQEADPDHKDITYTASQIKRFRDMYLEGAIADNDEPRKEKLKKSSYSKSTIRGASKGLEGPSHVGEMSGWEHLKGMKKPLLDEGIASVSAASADEDDIKPDLVRKAEWEAQQEKLRMESMAIAKQFKDVRKPSPAPERMTLTKDSDTESIPRSFGGSDSEESEPEAFKRAKKKTVGFQVQDV